LHSLSSWQDDHCFSFSGQHRDDCATRTVTPYGHYQSSRVHSMGGKWYVLFIVTLGFFFLESKDEVFDHFQILALRLSNDIPTTSKLFAVTMGLSLETPFFDQFCLEHAVDQ
jgi:hypothetical protein